MASFQLNEIARFSYPVTPFGLRVSGSLVRLIFRDPRKGELALGKYPIDDSDWMVEIVHSGEIFICDSWQLEKLQLDSVTEKQDAAHA